MMQPSVIDLFCGAGGLSLGFRLAGCVVTHAVEMDRWAATTYRTNSRQTILIEGDVRSVDPRQLNCGTAKHSPLFAIIGGPPCQGFSETNRRTRSVDNKQNYLYREFFRFVRTLRPAWFVLENVAGLRTLAAGTFLKSIMRSAKRAGYTASAIELNAADYGVPQFRRRLFIIGNRFNYPISLPSSTCGLLGRNPYVTVREAISDLPVLANGASTNVRSYRTAASASYQRRMRTAPACKQVSGNLVTRSNATVIERYRMVRQGDNWASIPSILFSDYKSLGLCHTGLYHRLDWDAPASVIGNFRKNMIIHPTQQRGLSIREAARLQSFPDHYVFCGSIGFQQQQVADAVPPSLSRAIAETIILASACARAA